MGCQSFGALVTDRLPFLCAITLLGHFTRQHDHRLLTQLSRGGLGDGVCKVGLNEGFDLEWREMHKTVWAAGRRVTGGSTDGAVVRLIGSYYGSRIRRE